MSLTVDTAVNRVGDPAFWLLDVVQDLGRLWVRNDAAVARGRLALDLGLGAFRAAHIDAQNRPDTVVLLVHLEHLCERERRADVNVADDNVFWGGCAQDLVADWKLGMSWAPLTVVQPACGTEGAVLAQIPVVSSPLHLPT